MMDSCASPSRLSRSMASSGERKSAPSQIEVNVARKPFRPSPIGCSKITLDLIGSDMTQSSVYHHVDFEEGGSRKREERGTRG